MSKRLLAALLLAASLYAPATAAAQPAIAAPTSPSFPADPFAAYVEAAMRQWPDPGLAIAVVQGGKPILVRGFGIREVGKRAPVNERTTFNIGSVTKSFTAALAATMVDQKLLTMDEPISKLLPGQPLPGGHPEETTLRDLLSHRSGWAGANWSLMAMPRAEIVGRLGALTEVARPRTRFVYNNIGYLAAGESLARRLGTSWDDAVRRRLLEPAGLSDAYTSGAKPRAPGNAARPHAVLKQRVSLIEPLPVNRVAPAGGIYASAHDLSRWMLMHLQGGELEGKRILSPEAVRAMQSPVIPIPVSPVLKKLSPTTNFYNYGLGWFVQDYRGYKLVQHGGNTAGKSALIAMVPDLGFGIAVLSNLDSSDLPTALAYRAVDLAIGGDARDWSKELRKPAQPATAAAKVQSIVPAPRQVDAARYVGIYQSPLYGRVTVAETRQGLRFVVDRAVSGTLRPLAEHKFEVVWADPYLAEVGLKGPLVFTFDGASSAASSLTFENAANPPPVYQKNVPDPSSAPEARGGAR